MHRFHPDRFSIHTLATHVSHPTGFAALGTPLLVPFDTANPKAPYLSMLQRILPAALRKGLCVRKHRLMTRLLHRKRNVWPYWLTTHHDRLADGPVMYVLLIQAPCVKRAKAKQIAQLCAYCLDVLRGKMKLPHSLYPGWTFSAAQLR